jgi:hypothetical protein
VCIQLWSSSTQDVNKSQLGSRLGHCQSSQITYLFAGSQSIAARCRNAPGWSGVLCPRCCIASQLLGRALTPNDPWARLATATMLALGSKTAVSTTSTPVELAEELSTTLSCLCPGCGLSDFQTLSTEDAPTHWLYLL